MSSTAWHKKLHWRILAGLGLGIIYGVAAAAVGWVDFTADWISPFGTIFVNLLKLIAVLLLLAVTGQIIWGAENQAILTRFG